MRNTEKTAPLHLWECNRERRNKDWIYFINDSWGVVPVHGKPKVFALFWFLDQWTLVTYLTPIFPVINKFAYLSSKNSTMWRKSETDQGCLNFAKKYEQKLKKKQTCSMCEQRRPRPRRSEGKKPTSNGPSERLWAMEAMLRVTPLNWMLKFAKNIIIGFSSKI